MFAMSVETLNCPMCGASVSSDAPQCRYCEARLATVSCPSCFAMMFLGSKHCPRCGAAAVQPGDVSNVEKKCPRCKTQMVSKSLGDAVLLECDRCLGLWLNVATFEKICADREHQSAVLGAATIETSNRTIPQGKVSYVPCPECSQLMNRANFARCSGVIVDLCKKHGIWFDRNELSRIIEFIREGGLEMSRTREKMHLEEERRSLEQLKGEVKRSEISGFFDSERSITGIASTRGLLKFLLR
jgi:Zn-finger nucleic acid-binding protein